LKGSYKSLLVFFLPEEIGNDLRKRIAKDLDLFDRNLLIADRSEKKTEEIKKMIELARMYASDSRSYLNKGDLPTSFSCIAYAHGLLDAALTFMGLNKYK
jgi:uncharacterized protein